MCVWGGIYIVCIYIKIIFGVCLFGVFIFMVCIYMVCNYGVCVSIWCVPMVCACCGIPPLKPRPGRVRGGVIDGVYRRHPLSGDEEHHSLPNQRDWGTPGRRQRSHFKRSRRTDIRQKTRSERQLRSIWCVSLKREPVKDFLK